MKNKKCIVVLMLLLAVPFGHLIFNFLLGVQFNRILDKRLIDLGYISSGNKHKIKLLGVYGDVFEPKKYNSEIDYDIVPVTCIIDPISLSKNTISWKSNDLLRSALTSTFPDPAAFKKTVDELITTMSINGELIKYFLFTPPDSYKIDEYLLRKEGKVYFWEVPKKGNFYLNTKILKMAALPIFNPEIIKESYDRKRRLRDNLEHSIRRLFREIEVENSHEINTVAFAALAGTTRRLDSYYYLDYTESFFTIYNALLSSDIPKQIDKVYLVVYDNLPSKKEERDALNGLFRVFRYSRHFDFEETYFLFEHHILRALPFMIIFMIMFLVTHPKIKKASKGKNQVNFLIETGTIFSIIFPIIATSFHFVLLTMRCNFMLTIGGEILISYILYRTILWINEI